MMRVFAYGNLQVIQFSDGDLASRLQKNLTGSLTEQNESACV
jgi:hypothetical protein